MTVCKRCGGSGEEPGPTAATARVTWRDGTPVNLGDPEQREAWKYLNYIDSLGHPVLYPASCPFDEVTGRRVRNEYPRTP